MVRLFLSAWLCRAARMTRPIKLLELAPAILDSRDDSATKSAWENLPLEIMVNVIDHISLQT